MSVQPALYRRKAEVHLKRVWFDSGNALNRGEGVCYEQDYTGSEDYEDAADPYEFRDNVVEEPNAENSHAFAGVAAEDYDAETGGQWIIIYEPGSVCRVKAHVDCTSGGPGGQRITCCGQADSAGTPSVGEFYKPGHYGRGSAMVLQSVDRSSTAGLVLVKLEDGQESGLVEELATVDNDAMTDPLTTGVCYIIQGAATSGGNATCTLGDALIHGLRKDIYMSANPGTNDVDLTVTNHETADPEHLFFNDGEHAQLEWNEYIGQWQEIRKTAETS